MWSSERAGEGTELGRSGAEYMDVPGACPEALDCPRSFRVPECDVGCWNKTEVKARSDDQ